MRSGERVGCAVDRVDVRFGRVRSTLRLRLLVSVLALALAPFATAQRLAEGEARFAWPRGAFTVDVPPGAWTRVDLEVALDGVDSAFQVTIRTTREMDAEGRALVWNQAATYRYSWVDRGALFLAVPEDREVDYAGVPVEAYDKALATWVVLVPPVVQRADVGPRFDLALELFGRATGLARGPLTLVGQVALELAALGDVMEGRIDVREVQPPLEGGFVDPNGFDLISLRFLEPRIALEYPAGSAGVQSWYSATDFFDLRGDPTMTIRFVVPIDEAPIAVLARVEAWVVFVQHYAAWNRGATGADLVEVRPHALTLRAHGAVDPSSGGENEPERPSVRGPEGPRAPAGSATLTLVVMPSLTSAFSLARHDLVVVLEGPERRTVVEPNVGSAFPVTLVIADLRPGTYLVRAEHGNSSLERVIEVRGDTLDFQMVMS